MHFRQGFDSKAYKDRIYKKLQIDQIRDKILQGELDISECDDNDVYSFLKLLKRQYRDSECSIPMEISKEKWEKVVRKAKRKSVSSIFQTEHIVCINVRSRVK